MIYLLLIIYQIKHFIADYPLQGRYMLGKFKDGNAWIMPLLAHAGVHSLFTLLIALTIKPKYAIGLALLDGTIHFIMDRIKASPHMLGRFKALSANEMKQEMYAYSMANSKWDKDISVKAFKNNTYFWWALGLDQGVHHLTHYLLIYLMLS